jgi:hypothetical protein
MEEHIGRASELLAAHFDERQREQGHDREVLRGTV